MNDLPNYKCGRCGHNECEVGEIYAAGGVLGKIFDVEGRHFSTVTCNRCKRTELFKEHKGALSSIFDVFVT
jgi:uncharacterized protein